MPPEQLPVDNSPEFEALLLQNDENARTNQDQLDALLVQGSENKDTLEEMKELQKEAVDELKDLKETIKTEKPEFPAFPDFSPLFEKISLMKGEKGDTPVKGKDYYTKEEIAEVVKEIQDSIRVPEDGKTPVKGEDYFTEQEISSIVDEVFSRIPTPKDGEDAEVDYEMVISECMAKMPAVKNGKDGKDGTEITAEQILEKIRGLLSYNDLKDLPTIFKQNNVAARDYDLVDLKDVSITSPSNGQVLTYDSATRKWINSAGGGGGGGSVDSVVAGTGISVDNTDPANPIVSSTITQYTDEMAQDAVGSILDDGGDIDFTYDDATPKITAAVKSGLDASKIADGSVSNAEFQYLNGVTSAIQTQLDGKVDENGAIVGATKTKITYDAKGLVTAGTDATTADIADSTNKRYVTDDERDLIPTLSGTGLLTGGVLSINVDTTKFDLSAGEGYIVDNHTDPTNPTVTHVTWGAFTAQVVTNLATERTTNIFIDSAGAIVQDTGTMSVEDSRDYIIIGRLVHTNMTNLSGVTPFPRVLFNASLDADDLANAIGSINITGNTFSANGANLNINKSAGTTYRTGTNYVNSKKSPNITTDASATPVTFAYQYRDGAGGFTTTATTTTVDPSSYDDGDGTLETVSNNKWTIQRIYFSAASMLTFITYGQAQYNTKADAVAAISSENPSVSPALAETSLRAFLVVKKGETALNSTSTAFISGGKFGEPLAGGATGGDVVGPASATDGVPALFDGATGKLIKNSTPTGTGNPVMATSPAFTTSILPSANDAASVGISGTAWSDLFLASGGVVNWNGGNATITHSAGLLTSNVDIAVPDEVYGVGWNGSTEVPTKNAVYDKIETLGGGTPGGADTQVQFNDGGAFGGDAGMTYNKTTDTLTIGNVSATKQIYYSTVTDNGNSGAADTIDWTLGNHQKSTLTGNCTYTFTAPTGPATLTLRVIQDGTGSRTATWPATVKWAGGVAPVMTPTASAYDLVSFMYDGTNYYGAVIPNLA